MLVTGDKLLLQAWPLQHRVMEPLKFPGKTLGYGRALSGRDQLNKNLVILYQLFFILDLQPKERR